MHSYLVLAKKNARLAAISLAAVMMVFGNIVSVSAATLDGVLVEQSDPRVSETGVSYTIDVTTGYSALAKCIDVTFAVNADGSGGVPTGMVTTGASLTSTTSIGAWATEDVTVNGRLRLSDTTGELPGAGDYVWAGITNGSTAETAYYAVLQTYSDDTCATPVDNVSVAFVFTNGSLVQLTIPPTLSFTCTGVASGQDVFPLSAATLNSTVASTGTSIDHGTAVTASTNGISAHDLNIATNASGGYNVYIRHTGPLTNAGLDTITDWTGTNAVPTSFPAAGTEAWGYSTDDADLTQFYGLDLWAGFPTALGSGGDLVATSATATASTETVRVGHQVGISTVTEAGTYQTTVIYTVVATY